MVAQVSPSKAVDPRIRVVLTDVNDGDASVAYELAAGHARGAGVGARLQGRVQRRTADLDRPLASLLQCNLFGVEALTLPLEAAASGTSCQNGGDGHGKNTGRGHCVGTAKDAASSSAGPLGSSATPARAVLNGNPNQHKGVRNEK